MGIFDEAAEEARPWVERAARLGFAAKSLVYLVVAGLSGAAALGIGGRATGPVDAIVTIAATTVGRVFLGVAAPGLFGYALWRLSQAVTDARGVGHGLLGLTIRAADAITGVVYAVLFYVVVHELVDPDQPSFGGTRHLLQAIVGTPVGAIGFGVVGLVVMGTGAVQVFKAVSGIFRRTLEWQQMGPLSRGVASVLGRLAFMAWGAIFGLLGWSMIRAALSRDVREAHGIGGTLREAATTGRFHPWPLFFLSLGLLCFALYAALETRFRRIRAARRE